MNKFHTYSYLFYLLLIWITVSCEFQSNHDTNKTPERNEEEIQAVQILEKDTLFSRITSDLTYEEGDKILRALAREQSNFQLDRREAYASALTRAMQPNLNTTYFEPVYIMVFNGKSYMFEIDFNSYGWITPGYVQNGLTPNPDNKKSPLIDLVALSHTTTEDKYLINNVLNIFLQKYGNFDKKTEKYNSYGFGTGTRETSKLTTINNVDTYTWKDTPKLKIEQRIFYKLDCRHSPEKTPYYEYKTTIIYYSKRFLNNLKNWQEQKEIDKIEAEREIERKAERQNVDL